MAGPDRFRNLQTDLFCIKRDFIGPIKYSFWIKICQNVNGCGVYFMIGPNIHTFWSNTLWLLTCQAINCPIIQFVIQTLPTD